MTRKRFIKLCMGRLGLSRNEAAAIAESKGITYHYARIAFSLQDCAAACVAQYSLISSRKIRSRVEEQILYGRPKEWIFPLLGAPHLRRSNSGCRNC